MSAGARILVIDDDTLQLKLLELVLARDGFAVAVGPSMNDIAPLAKEFRPDVVLMDVNIPGASRGAGLSIARAAAPARTLFYLFSSWDDARLEALARELRADGWLSKNMPAAEVSRRLLKIAGRSR